MTERRINSKKVLETVATNWIDNMNEYCLWEPTDKDWEAGYQPLEAEDMISGEWRRGYLEGIAAVVMFKLGTPEVPLLDELVKPSSETLKAIQQRLSLNLKRRPRMRGRALGIYLDALDEENGVEIQWQKS